jgi:tetratricopeptide (TPR) repeat protein
LVLRKNPRIASARLRLGSVLHQLGDLEGAIREWKLAAEYDPDDTRPPAYLASVGVKPG